MRFQKARGTKRVINGGGDGDYGTFYVPEAEKRKNISRNWKHLRFEWRRWKGLTKYTFLLKHFSECIYLTGTFQASWTA